MLVLPCYHLDDAELAKLHDQYVTREEPTVIEIDKQNQSVKLQRASALCQISSVRTTLKLFWALTFNL